MIIDVEYTIAEIICSTNSTDKVKIILIGILLTFVVKFLGQLLFIQHVQKGYLECHFILFSRVRQKGKEPHVQIAKPHKQHSGEEILVASPCAMPVVCITNYIT